MQYKLLPNTSIQVSQLSLGTMMFGGQTSEADSLSIMDYAFEQGINLFDTANMYNAGESERIVGKALKGRRDRILVATKVRNQMGDDRNGQGLNRRNIRAAVEASLKRLDTDYIDIYYLHRPDDNTSIEETMEAMHSLVKEGKILYIGISNYAAWQAADILALCDKRNYIAPIITQNVYNLLTRGIESEFLPFVKKHEMGLTIYNPIAAGLLAGKHKRGSAPAADTRFSTNAMYFDRYWKDQNFVALEQLMKIAEDHGMSILEMAMKWCVSRPLVTTVITGVSKLAQLEQNIRVIEGDPLPADLLEQCDQVWHALAGTPFQYNR